MNPHSILVVEDERIIASDIRATLLRMGYSVPATAATGPDALARAAEHQPDLLLMDIRLRGEMDGIQATEAIHARFDIPVIYLTAFADDATRLRARQTAPYGYLVKPFDERTLQTTVEMAIERHTRDRQVRVNQHWLMTTLSSLSDGLVAIDAQGRIIFANPVAEQLLRRTQPELAGQAVASVIALLDPETRQPIAHPAQTALQTGAPVYLADDAVLITPDGAEIFIHASAAPIAGTPKTGLGAVMIFQNSATRRQAETERLAEQRRAEQAHAIERLRVLSTGIAHTINNALTAILGNVELALFVLPQDSSAHEYVGQISAATRRAANLTRQLQLYADSPPAEQEPIDLNALASETVASLKSTALKQIIIRATLTPGLPPIAGDEAQLRQVVQHLLINAAEAIGDTGGNITITTAIHDLAGGEPVDLQLPAGPYVVLDIADTGCGMDETTQARVFDPFFTTKFTGRGLGLAAVLSIVRAHHGAVTVRSTVGQGTTFRVYLPPADERSLGALPKATPAAAGGRAVVLLVDNEAKETSI